MLRKPSIVDLRVTLAKTPAAQTREAQKRLAEDAMGQILDAIEQGVCELGNWEMRCLNTAISVAHGGSYDLARSIARKALWPEENRRASEVARYRINQDTATVAGLRKAIAMLRAAPVRSPGKHRR